MQAGIQIHQKHLEGYMLQENIDSTSKQQLSIVNRISGELQVNLRKLQKTNKKAGADAPETRKDGILTSV